MELGSWMEDAEMLCFFYLNFAIIDWQMETADGGTHENQVQANAFYAICTWKMLTAIYRGGNEKI